MAKFEPYLALDSAGERTILCDHPVKMFDNTTEATSKMRTMSTFDGAEYGRLFVKSRAAANKYWARCMGQDAAMGDETVEKLKSFLQSKLSSEDHAAACAMMDGGGAQDDPPLEDVEGNPAMDGLSARQRMQAVDGMIAKRAKARDDFFERYPDAHRIKIDTSGLPLPARATSHSDAEGAKRFFDMFPDAKRIKIL